jgi:uncharacterized protein with FMN-binding domain
LKAHETSTDCDRGHRRGARRTIELQFECGESVARLVVGGDGAASIDDDNHNHADHYECPSIWRTTPPPTTTTVAPTTTTPTPSATRSATGESANYNYGILSVKVTVSGSKILNISIASIDDGGNPRSEYVDQQSIPLLEQEALSAQSANIQGVSGASYTSAGFEQSLQSALSKLGL